jgi:DNA-binding MarR family transcriptional regulator
MSTEDNPLGDRMAVLLKHARQALAELTGPALTPFGIDGRGLAVLTVLAGPAPSSQQQAGERLGVDRTTMVALIDGLEGKGLVARAPHPADRRRNVVHLTPAGRDTLERATVASWDAERRFLAPLTEAQADTLRGLLRALIGPASPSDTPGQPSDTPGQPAGAPARRPARRPGVRAESDRPAPV